MKQLLTLAAAVLITGTVLTPGFAQDKMTKKAGKPTECAACKKMHAAMKAKMSSGNKMSGDKKKM